MSKSNEREALILRVWYRGELILIEDITDLPLTKFTEWYEFWEKKEHIRLEVKRETGGLS